MTNHAVFALFPDEKAAAAAVDDARSESELQRDNLSVVVHHEPARFPRLKDLTESAAGPAFRRGLLFGAWIGAVAGALLGGPIGLIAAGPAAGAAFGAVAGSMYGSLGAALIGASMPNQGLDRLLKQVESGNVLVTFKLDHRASEHRIHSIVAGYGAEVAARPLV